MRPPQPGRGLWAPQGTNSSLSFASLVILPRSPRKLAFVGVLEDAHVARAAPGHLVLAGRPDRSERGSKTVPLGTPVFPDLLTRPWERTESGRVGGVPRRFETVLFGHQEGRHTNRESASRERTRNAFAFPRITRAPPALTTRAPSTTLGAPRGAGWHENWSCNPSSGGPSPSSMRHEFTQSANPGLLSASSSWHACRRHTERFRVGGKPREATSDHRSLRAPSSCRALTHPSVSSNARRCGPPMESVAHRSGTG